MHVNLSAIDKVRELHVNLSAIDKVRELHVNLSAIDKVTHTHTELFSDGAARKIEFSLSLKRVDKSLVAIYGDMKTQADNLVTSASDWLGGLAG
ncbi:hypothetical protein DOU50_17495 [Enterobacter sp. C6]|nr:hypothetical protein DOU50_17495 [Enterobacter sp. C6]